MASGGGGSGEFSAGAGWSPSEDGCSIGGRGSSSVGKWSSAGDGGLSSGGWSSSEGE